jgi:UDP-glucuronate decarboxylase
MTKRTLITGGAGFLGLHLARRLADEAGHEVTLVDNFRRGRLDDDLSQVLDLPNTRLIEADLADPAAYETLGTGYDEVYHLAAVIGVRNVLERPHDVVRINALTTIYLLDWMVEQNRQGRFLFSSTSEAYAWTRQFMELPTPTPEDVPLALTDLSNPRSSYAGSKIFGELAVHQYGAKHSMEFVILRYHNIYGPRMGWDHVVPELFERATAGEDPLRVFSPDHTRAFCFVDDGVDATIKAMRAEGANGETFHIGNDHEELEIRRLARLVLQQSGHPERAIQEESDANDPINRRCPDVSRARSVLGYEPIVSMEEGLARTLAWYRAHSRPTANN